MFKVKNKLFLAPLDGVNCAAFRILCKKNGAGLISTAMIDTNAFLNSRDRFYWYKKEKPLLVQFIGNDPNTFKECVKNVKGCSAVDLNAGCPSDDQNLRGCGAALLKNLPLLKKIVETMTKYSPYPVSVKYRMGWEKDISLKIAKTIELAGASFMCIHPRTKFQGYGTPADWSVIKRVKESSKIPVFASGDLLTAEKVRDCFNTTKCDGVMIARGAINDPLIFNDSLRLIKTKKIKKHTIKERVRIVKDFIKLYHKYDKYELSELRNHCTWLVKEIPNASKVRDLIGKSKNEENIIKILNSIDSSEV